MQIGFTGLLTLIFITLKLTNFIDWPWVWVLAPFWIPILVIVVFLFVAALCGVNIKVTRK